MAYIIQYSFIYFALARRFPTMLCADIIYSAALAISVYVCGILFGSLLLPPFGDEMRVHI